MVHSVIRRMLPLAAAGFLLMGCARAMSPVSGVWYTAVKAPLAVSPQQGSSKMGTSTCSSILGLIAMGDASIEAAAKAGGISKIHHVDYQASSILGLYATFTTVVYGE